MYTMFYYGSNLQCISKLYEIFTCPNISELSKLNNNLYFSLWIPLYLKQTIKYMCIFYKYKFVEIEENFIKSIFRVCSFFTPRKKLL